MEQKLHENEPFLVIQIVLFPPLVHFGIEGGLKNLVSSTILLYSIPQMFNGGGSV